MAAPKFLRNVAGIFTEIIAAVVATADSIVATGPGGTIDVSFLPSGVGPAIVPIDCSENLSAGDFVNIYDNAGSPNCRKADGSTTGKPANGFVLSAFTSGNPADVYMPGQINDQVTSVDGGPIWLSVTTPGGFQDTAPTATGQISQKIGSGAAATKIIFDPQPEIVLA